ncbi:polysaccharide pyruvyl transferase CsaB [Intestinibacillus massiliensis]|nr:polysaccharide pyruvyl transferase CsaB [Intestinibacillus massiliensis]
MKLLHMMGGGDVGGAKTHIMSIITALRGRGHEVHLVSFRDGPFPQEAAARGVPVTVIEHMSPFKCRRELLRVVDAFQPDVIHCHGAKANLMGAMARAKRQIPVMTTVHSDYRLDYLGSPFKQMTRGTLNAVALRFLDFYQPVADRMARTLIARGFDPERMVTIYNGMDFDGSVEGLDRAAYIREKWGVEIGPGDVLCGIAARLTAVKDIATTVRAFAKALQEAPQLRLFIAGDGEDEDMLRKLAKQLGADSRIIFCGWVTDVPQYFACMDINLLSSLSETFPYSILEGVREHCATICSDVGGMPDLIDAGENGFIFQPGDDGALAKYMARLANDPEMRRRFAGLLYEKASREFSLQTMCDTQIHNYERVLELFHQPKARRAGVVICGAYGKGNAGDDAILKAIVQEVREIDPTRPIWVMSRRPKETRVVYRTNAMYTFNVPAVLHRFRRSALYINGGGSLMQDVTSTRSLHYYLYTLRAAKSMGCRVMMYGCGIGPINRPANRRAAAKAINRAVDLITLRDDLSRGELTRMGITRPDIRLSADPTIILEPTPRETVDLTLEALGIPPEGRYIGFGLRNWKGLDGVLGEIAEAADYAYEKHGLIPLFVPIEFPSDLYPAQRVAEKLHCPHYTIDTRQPIEMTIGILSRMQAVVGIRLHSLMFSAGHGVPVIGMSYDIKVDGFLKYIGSRTCIQLTDVTAEAMKPLIDECVSGALDAEVQRMAVLLRQREHENTAGAKRLLDLGTVK